MIVQVGDLRFTRKRRGRDKNSVRAWSLINFRGEPR